MDDWIGLLLTKKQWNSWRLRASRVCHPPPSPPTDWGGLFFLAWPSTAPIPTIPPKNRHIMWILWEIFALEHRKHASCKFTQITFFANTAPPPPPPPHPQKRKKLFKFKYML